MTLYSNAPSLDLHGIDREYAKILTREFIDDNYKLKNDTAIIIHGIGTGIVKRAVHEELKHNKYIKELRIKQNIYENYFGLKREKEIKNIQHEIKKQTGILSKQICELEVKCETSKEVLSLREKYKDKKDLLDSLFFDVISVMHPSIYSLKRDSLWERAKNAYLNYDDTTLMLLKNLKVNKRKDLNIADLKNDIFLLQNEIICMKRRYPYYLENNLLSSEWVESYNKEINTRIKKLQVKEKEIFEKLV